MPRKIGTADALTMFADRAERVATEPNINRFVALPQQKLFLMDQSKIRVLMGGNRAGKTEGGGADDVYILTRTHPWRNHLYADRPRKIRFIGVDFERGIDQTALPLFSRLIPPSKLINGSWEDSYSKGEHMLTLADKSTCSFMAYTQESKQFQSVSLDHIHFDEEPPKEIFDESLKRIWDTAGSWTLSETPVQQLEWFQDEYLESWENGDRPNMNVFYLNTLDNTNLDVSEMAEEIRHMTADEKAVRLEGRYITGGSLVFPEFTRKYPNLIPQLDFIARFRADRDRWVIYSHMDHGYANPTAWIWTAVHEDGSIVTIDVLYSKEVTPTEWAARWHEKNREIAEMYGLDRDFEPFLTVGDPAINQRQASTGITIQQEYSMLNVPIATEGIVKTRTGNQNVGLSKIHTYLRSRPIRAGVSAATGVAGEPWWQMLEETTTALADEIKKARKPRQTRTQKEVANVSEEIRDKDNHAIDASKYLFMMTHDLRPEEFQDEDQRMLDAVHDNFSTANPPPGTHYEALQEINTPWTTTESDSYSRLEN